MSTEKEENGKQTQKSRLIFFSHNFILQGLRLKSIWLFNTAFAQKHHLVKQNILTGDRETDGRTDRRVGGWTDGWTDCQKDG